jgi:hypothetical protein
MFCHPKANLIIASRRSRYFLNESDKSQKWRWSGAGWLSRQGRYSGDRSSYYRSGALENIFFTTFSTVWDIELLSVR